MGYLQTYYWTSVSRERRRARLWSRTRICIGHGGIYYVESVNEDRMNNQNSSQGQPDDR